MSDTTEATTTLPPQSDTIYSLVNIREGTFVKRAFLWEVCGWMRLLQGVNGWKNPTYKRLDVLRDEELRLLYTNTTGNAPPDDPDQLKQACVELSKQVPIDETTAAQIKEMCIQAGIPPLGSDSIQPKTKEKAPIMTTENTAGAAGTDATAAAASTTAAATEGKKEKAPRPKGAKVLVRELYAANPAGEFTVEEISTAIGKPASSVTTALSDLRSEKYCKPGEPLVLHRHASGKYSLTAEVKPEAPPAAAAGTQSSEALPLG